MNDPPLPHRDHGVEVLPEDVLVRAQTRVGVEEQHALLFQICPNCVVNHF
jgi:hypothetical protein